VDLLKAAGFKWIALKGHAGTQGPFPGRYQDGHPPDSLIASLRQKGFDVGCWGAFGSQDDPKGCAWAANGACWRYGYSFYIANMEVLYPDREFLEEWNRIKPKKAGFATWLSCEISNPRAWSEWFGAGKAGSAWLPQCYTNVNPGATPAQAAFWAARKDGHGYNIPLTMVKPTIGLYDPRQDINQYIRELREGQTIGLGKGFSIWLGETATRAEIQALGSAIRSAPTLSL
jgi:hypothetical protein